MRSPLRYPGGKTRARSIIVPEIQRQNAKTLISPFIGGGSIELAWLEKNPGGAVEAYDLYEPLVSFWNHALTNPQGVASLSKMHMPCSKELFKELQKKIGELKGIEQAASFFVVNRCSFSGSTNSGGMSPGHIRFNDNAVMRLNDFKGNGLTVSHRDSLKVLEETLSRSPEGCAMYLDPPYDITGANLYGTKGNMHKGFDHERLAQLCSALDELGWKFIMSYNDSERIRGLYSNFSIRPATWSYSMRGGQASEILISSRNWK